MAFMDVVGTPTSRRQLVASLRTSLPADINGGTSILLAAGAAAVVIFWLLSGRGGQGSTVDPQELAAARLKHFEAKKRKHRSPSKRPAVDTGTVPWDPPRYKPAADEGLSEKTLRIKGELLEVRDGGYAWQRASCLLDTGNLAITVVDDAYARRHQIFVPGTSSVFARAEREVTLRGVVPGAEVRAPVVTVALRLRGRLFTLSVAISPLMGGEDVLLGVDVLEQLFAEGWRIG